MTVQCPRCGTQYRVPDARLSDPRPVFKCTRCNHVFSSGERTGGRGARAIGDDRNLKLPFGGRRGGVKAVPAGSAESDPATPPVPEPAKRLADPIDDDEDETDLSTTASDGKRDAGTQGDAPDGSEPAFVAGGGLDEPDEPDALESEEAGPTGAPAGGEAGEVAPRRQRIRRARRAVELEEDPVVDEDEGPILIRESDARATVDPVRRAATPARRHRSPMRPVLTGVAAVLAGFLGLSAMLRQHPDVALERLASVPLLGRLIGDDRLMLVRLDVSGLESSIERIKGERPALVVSGRVTNTTGQNLSLRRQPDAQDDPGSLGERGRDATQTRTQSALRRAPGRVDDLPAGIPRSAVERDRGRLSDRRCPARLRACVRSGRIRNPDPRRTSG